MYIGCNRLWSKRIAIVLIAIGILMLPDVIAPTPFMDLLINMPLAFFLADILAVSYLEAFVLTYVISFMLLLAGLMVYPYNTKHLINGRIKASVSFIRANPIMLIAAIIGLLLVYLIGQYLYDTLWQYARAVIGV